MFTSSHTAPTLYATGSTEVSAHRVFTNDDMYDLNTVQRVMDSHSDVLSGLVETFFDYADHVSGACLNMYLFLVNSAANSNFSFNHLSIIPILATYENTDDLTKYMKNNWENTSKNQVIRALCTLWWTTHGVSWDTALSRIRGIVNSVPHKVDFDKSHYELYCHFSSFHSRFDCDDNEKIFQVQRHIFNKGKHIDRELWNSRFATIRHIEFTPTSFPVRNSTHGGDTDDSIMTLEEITDAVLDMPQDHAAEVFVSTFNVRENNRIAILAPYDTDTSTSHHVRFQAAVSQGLRGYRTVMKNTTDSTMETVYNNPEARAQWLNVIAKKYDAHTNEKFFLRDALSLCTYYALALPVDYGAHDDHMMEDMAETIVSAVVNMWKQWEEQHCQEMTVYGPNEILFNIAFTNSVRKRSATGFQHIFPPRMMSVLWDESADDRETRLRELMHHIITNGVVSDHDADNLVSIITAYNQSPDLPRQWMTPLLEAQCTPFMR